MEDVRVGSPLSKDCKAVHMEETRTVEGITTNVTWDEHEGVGLYVNWQNSAGREV